MSAVVCSCGGNMTVERVELADGRRRFSLTCDDCWDGIVEYSRSELVEVMLGGEMVALGYVRVPAA
jgi:hypothetical protein